MGNQQTSTRFTLRNLSWRPPKNPQQQQRQQSNGWGSQVDDADWGDDDISRSSVRTVNFNPFSRISSKLQSMRMTRAQPSMREQSIARESISSGWTEATEKNQEVSHYAPAPVYEDDEPEEEPEGLEYEELHQKLVQFYERNDPEAIRNREIDIEGMVRWTLEDEDGSLEELNEKLYDRFGNSLEDLEDDVESAPSAPKSTPMAPPPQRMSNSTFGSQSESENTMWSDEEEEEKGDGDDDDLFGENNDYDRESKSNFHMEPEDSKLSQTVREQLERFFLTFDPDGLQDGGVEEMFQQFRQQGRMAMNVALYRKYGKNLTSMLATEQNAGQTKNRNTTRKSTATASVISSQPLGRTNRKKSTTEKFGVHVAPDQVLQEMSQPRELKSARLQQKKTTIRKDSNVSASLQRRWNHLANVSRGMSTRISTKVSKPATSNANHTHKHNNNTSSRSSVMTVASKKSSPGVNSTFKPSARTAVMPAKPPSSRQMSVKIPTGDCPGFKLNLNGAFGTCSNCGKPKSQHYTRQKKLAETLRRRWKKIDHSPFSS